MQRKKYIRAPAGSWIDCKQIHKRGRFVFVGSHAAFERPKIEKKKVGRRAITLL